MVYMVERAFSTKKTSRSEQEQRTNSESEHINARMFGSGRGVCCAFASAARAGVVVANGVMLSEWARSGRRELGVVDEGGDSGCDGCIGDICMGGTGDLAVDVGDSVARLPSGRPEGVLRRCASGSGASETASHSKVAGTRPKARSSGRRTVAHDE